MSQIPVEVVKLKNKSDLAHFITIQKLEAGDLSELFNSIEDDILLGIIGPNQYRYFLSFQTGCFYLSRGTKSTVSSMLDVHTWLPQVIKNYGPDLVDVYKRSSDKFIKYCNDVLNNDLSLYDISSIIHDPIPYVYYIMCHPEVDVNIELISTNAMASMLYCIHVLKQPSKLVEHIIFRSWTFIGDTKLSKVGVELAPKYMRLYSLNDSISVIKQYPAAIALYAVKIRKSRWKQCEDTMFDGVTAQTLLPVLIYCDNFSICNQRITDLVESSGIQFYKALYNRVSLK